jgi:short-subunit dehydrogenase
VLVTGASSGIGRATAHRLARRGAHLVLASRSAAALSDVAAECRSLGASGADVVVLDVRSAEEVERAVRAADAAPAGPLVAVVHAAAVVTYGLVHRTPTEVLHRVVETNVLGSLHVATAAIQVFRDRGAGRLVLVSSVLGQAPVAVLGPYSVTKSAVTALGRVLRQEARDVPGLHVSVVSPGAVSTPLYDQAATFVGREGRPPPPVATPDAVARAIEDELTRRRPRGSVSVGGLNPVMRLAHAATPGLFDALVGPAMSALALGPPTASTTGNVFEPVSATEAVNGRWSTPAGRVLRPASGLPSAAAGTGGGVSGRSDSIPSVTRRVEATPDAVAAVLEDGWSYASWVVGTARIRAVSPDWPSPGARLHHSVGVWPALLSDETVCQEYERGSRLVLTAKGRPLGKAVVEIVITQDEQPGCIVAISEDATTSGIRSVVPSPVRDVLIRARNTEALRRLAMLAERSERPHD